MMKRFYTTGRAILLLAFMLVVACKLTAQLTITGPDCIIPGIIYQYDIKGARNDSSAVKVDIKGGVLTSGIRASTDRVKVSAVFVTWKDTAYHQINVQSKRGKSILLVQQTALLNGGKIKADHDVRRFDSTLNRYTFQCSLPTGGACAPNYTYQWQRSEDGLKWKDISKAKGKDLQLNERLSADTYFRRVTTETQSNTIGYSDVAVLLVLPY